MSKISSTSYLVMGLLVLACLSLRLVPAAFAGFLVFTLTRSLSALLLSRAPARLGAHVRALALAVVLLAVLALFIGVGAAAAHFLKSPDGMPWLFTHMADILDKVRFGVPAAVQSYIPATVDDLKTVVVEMLRAHGEKLSEIGVESVKSSALLLLALVAGAMVSWSVFETPEDYHPLAGALLQRCTRLTVSFKQVVFAQVKISLVNTVLTSLYLLVGLPLCGIVLPLAKTLVAVTFLAGLLPVVGNLISNGIIVTLSLGVSPQLGLASLAFLVGVHKLEYFLNAKIIGHDIDATAWELILAMIVMERLFGISGLVAAPVLYAYLKQELQKAALIGRRPRLVPTDAVSSPTPEPDEALPQEEPALPPPTPSSSTPAFIISSQGEVRTLPPAALDNSTPDELMEPPLLTELDRPAARSLQPEGSPEVPSDDTMAAVEPAFEVTPGLPEAEPAPRQNPWAQHRRPRS